MTLAFEDPAAVAMEGYSLRDVQQILGLSRAIITAFIDAGFVAPTLGKHRKYQFTFQDLVVLRAAQALGSANVPTRRISRSLKRLREQLPPELPVAGLRIVAVGDRVVVREGAAQWQAESGQYVLDFEVSPAPGGVSFVSRGKSQDDEDDWFTRACALEESDASSAYAAYQRVIELDPRHTGAYTNLGRLLHDSGRLAEAEAVYRKALHNCREDALLWFNLGVLLDDVMKHAEALGAYQKALQIEPQLADCHYNIALLYERLGRPRDALRHFSAFRKLEKV